MRLSFLITLFLLSTQVVGASNPVSWQGVPNYLFDAWKTEQGLPQVSVLALAQDTRGYLWIGTEEGLVRFDGLHFEIFDRSSRPELRSHFIQALLADPDGSLWIGTHHGLVHLQRGHLTLYATADGLAHQEIHALHRDRDANLWIGTAAGLSRFDGESFLSWTHTDGLPGDWVHAIEEDLDGTLWIGTDKGLGRADGGSGLVDKGSPGDVSLASVPGLGLPEPAVHALELNRQGDLWIGANDGLYTLKSGRIQVDPLTQTLAHPTVQSLHLAADDSLWIGTEKGLNRLAPDRAGDGILESYTLEAGLSDDWIASFSEDHEGSLWIGTRFGGVNRLRNAPIRSFGTPEGLVNDLVWGVTEDQAGNVWVATNEGLSQIRPNGTVMNYTVQDGLPDPGTGALYEDRRGRLWIGTFEHGLVRLEDGDLRVLGPEDGFPPVRVRRILEDSEGRFFIATNGGLFEYHAETGFKNWSVDDGLPHEHIRDLHADPSGGLWLATDGGLARFRDGKITAFPTDEDPLTDERIKSIYADDDGVLWLGTWERGLARFKDQIFRFVSVADGLHHRRIHRILQDDWGWLWMSSNQGVFRVRKSELDDLVDGKIHRVKSVVYGENAGMRSRECNGGAQPAGFKTRDGRLWFATIAGVAVVNPQNLQSNRVPPPVHIERVLVNHQSIDLQAVAADSRRIEAAPGSREFSFHSTALSFVAPENNRFRYKLEGFDNDWVDAAGRRAAYYTNLSPGSYRFHVMASNNEGVWNETGDSVELYVKPAFYQTWSFMLGMLLVSVAGIWTVHSMRVRHAIRQGMEKNRIELLEAKNSEMGSFTRTVAHDLKTPLFTIDGFLRLLERDLSREQKDEIPGHVRRIRNAVRQMGRLLDTLLELSHSGRVVDEPQPVDMDDLASQAVDLAAGLIAEKKVTVSIAPDLPTVSGDPNRLLQVLQNLITNGIKFMDPGQPQPQVEVGIEPKTLESRDKMLLFFVRDNGIGIEQEHQEKVFDLFDKLIPDAEGSGIGLAIVQRIIEAHGGRVRVESEGLGRGSTFYFSLPGAR